MTTGQTAASYERALTVSRVAGADYSGYTGSTWGENHFAKINTAEVTDYTSPDIPGRWYGSAGDPPPIPAGNVLVNTTDGGACPYLIVGKALPGQPIECLFSGVGVVVVGSGGVTVGDKISSDNTGAAQTADSGDYVLGEALATGAAGDLIAIQFAPSSVPLP